MKQLTILVDMDDTIENFCETLVEVLNERHGLKVKTDDIREWDLTKAFPSLAPRDIFAPTYEEDFWKRVKPLPGAVDYLRRMTDDGHSVVIVTASAPESVPLKIKLCLRRHFPFIKRENIIIASRKQLIKGDIMIDDAPHNLIGGDYLRVLMQANHNRDYDAASNGMVRVDGWDGAYRMVRMYADILEQIIE
jgi:5'(3')-deoxyribonucleotidase